MEPAREVILGRLALQGWLPKECVPGRPLLQLSCCPVPVWWTVGSNLSWGSWQQSQKEGEGPAHAGAGPLCTAGKSQPLQELG